MSAAMPGRSAAYCVLAIALALAAYATALRGSFTFDDQHEVVENTSITDLRQPGVVIRGAVSRPLTNASYALDYAIWGGRDPFGFHLTNILLHALNVGLLFVLVRRWTRQQSRAEAVADGTADIAAFAAAALFAVHPLMTEAVSYVSGRSDVLSTAFFLSSLYSLERARSEGRRWFWTGLACFFGALACKESAAVLPFVLLAGDLLLASATGRAERMRRLHAPLIALVLIAGVGRIWLYVAIEHAEADRLLGWKPLALQAHVAARYLGLLVMPVGQTVVPPVSPIESWLDLRLLTAALTLGLVAALAVFARARAPLAAFGLIWFGLALLPSSILSVLLSTGQAMAEHRVYLASCGFFTAVGSFAVIGTASAGRMAAGVRARLIVIGAALAVLFIATIARNQLWADPIELWQDAARKAPNTYAAQAGLGYAHWSAGDCAGAEPAYQAAMALRPEEPDPYVALADCYLRTRRPGEAIRVLRIGVDRATRDVRVRLMLAPLEERPFVGMGRAESVRLCREALAIDPRSREARECLDRYGE